MNNVTLIGRLTADPEKRFVGDRPTASFTIAVDRGYTKEDGTREADFPRIVAWGRLAEFVCQYFRQGKPVAVTGRLQTRSYKDKNGQTVYVTEVAADTVHFVPGEKRTDPPINRIPDELPQG